jgi:hypothetical protein
MWKAVLLAALALILGTASTARADGTTVIRTYACYATGGHTTAPAGTEIVTRFGWAALTYGEMQDFLNAQTTTESVNGGAPVDVSGGYDGPTWYPPASVWTSFVQYPTGVVLAAGQSMTFSVKLSLAHPVYDGATLAPVGTVGVFGCKVTGV